MTMIERPTDFDQSVSVPAAWSRELAPAQPECECPESCLIDHGN